MPLKKQPASYAKFDQANGTRDERGIKIAQYPKIGRKLPPMEGNELLATYELAKRNMKRRKDGTMKPKYETVAELQDAIIAYWDYLEDANRNGTPLIPDVEGLATFLDVTRATLMKWERCDRPGFAETVAQAKNDIAACKKQMGQQGRIPPIVMAMDFNNNHNYTQRQEVVVTPKDPLGESTATPELMDRYIDLIEDNPKQALPPMTDGT